MNTVILCGGSGTRLWPLSRTLYPKQFYPLFEGHSLYQRTLIRNAAHSHAFTVVVNAEQFFMAQDQYEALKLKHPVTFILEPEGRNTAPAIALAALAATPQELLLVVPSDHLINDLTAYEAAVTRARGFAQAHRLVTFGIKPTHPETGFGYIESDGTDVKRFKEKPDFATAKAWVDSGKFFWNSGMFCFEAKAFLDALAQTSPQTFEQSQKAFAATPRANPLRIGLEAMRAIPSDSIDYAVMEQASGIKMVPADIGWSDLGSFDALYDALPHDANGNTVTNNSLPLNARNNLVVSGKRLISLVDVEDLIVVDTPDALLITKRGSSQRVKDVVTQLKQSRPGLTHGHTTSHTPWGSYTILEEGPQFRVKHLVVKAGARLSLQTHAQRSEHWVVLEGEAHITLGDKTQVCQRNESAYIPVGVPHRLENRGNKELVIIEAQVGDYVGEDDIVRLVDDYRRD